MKHYYWSKFHLPNKIYANKICRQLATQDKISLAKAFLYKIFELMDPQQVNQLEKKLVSNLSNILIFYGNYAYTTRVN